MPTTPQDRKPKAGGPYKFKAKVTERDDNGEMVEKVKTFTLPSAAEGAAKVPGRYLRDASMNGEEGQMALGFATLEATGAAPEAINALYSLPVVEMMEHLEAWMRHKAKPEDASVGESSGSST